MPVRGARTNSYASSTLNIPTADLMSSSATNYLPSLQNWIQPIQDYIPSIIVLFHGLCFSYFLPRKAYQKPTLPGRQKKTASANRLGSLETPSSRKPTG
jgi:hypothetical protein